MLRPSSFAMPAMFATALIVSLIRVGATTSHEFFIEKPHIRAGDTATVPKLEWLAPDTDANWVVRYRNSAAHVWEESSASVAGRVSNEEMRVRRLYHASLRRLMPGDHFEVEVLRNGEKAFSQSGAVPGQDIHLHPGL